MNSDAFGIEVREPVEVTMAGPMRVNVVEFDMSFWRLVLFLVKVAFAAIPAMIILMLAYGFIAALVAAVLMAVSR